MPNSLLTLQQLVNQLPQFQKFEEMCYIDLNTDDSVSRRKKSNNPWSQEEDQMLLQLVGDKAEEHNWAIITAKLNHAFTYRAGRNAQQVSQRFYRVINPDVQKGPWKKEEDDQLLNALLQSKNKKWTAIAQQIPQRSDVQVRYRVKKIQNWLLEKGVNPEQL